MLVIVGCVRVLLNIYGLIGGPVGSACDLLLVVKSRKFKQK
jgi:hypothetical protein